MQSKEPSIVAMYSAREAQEGLMEMITMYNIACYEQDGLAYLNLKAVARGLGLLK